MAFGEVLVDWIPLELQRQGQLEIPIYGQFPGGAPANVAVAVAGLGQFAYMLGQVGADPAGVFLRDCLLRQQVNCDYLLSSEQHATPMAFVSLDANGERSFTFKRSDSADLKVKASSFPLSLFQSPGIVHVCSNTLTEAEIAMTTMSLLAIARQAGMLVSFDVNLRLALWQDSSALVKRVMALAGLSDMLKLSQQEWDYLTEQLAVKDLAASLFALGVQVILLTNGGETVQLILPKQRISLSPPQVEVVDTTGAGDAFTGAWLASLLEQQIDDLPALKRALARPQALQQALNYAVNAGALAVTKAGAWSALPCADELNAFIQAKE